MSRLRLPYWGLMALLLLSCVVCAQFSWADWLQIYQMPQSLNAELWWSFRLPRLICALCSGVLLSLAALLVQTQWRNDLAEPGLIGLSGGSALSAAIALSLQASVGVLMLSAFIGGLISTWVAKLLSRSDNKSSLLLAGIAINALCASALTLYLSFLDAQNFRSISFWLLGSFANLDTLNVWILSIFALIILVFTLKLTPYLNVLQLGQIQAFLMGYPVKTFEWLILLIACVATSAVVSQVGMIGFVGLMAPHIARLFKPRHFLERVIYTAFMGAILCLWADFFAKNLLDPAELPVGVITSLLGAPFFLYLLHQSKAKAF